MNIAILCVIALFVLTIGFIAWHGHRMNKRIGRQTALRQAHLDRLSDQMINQARKQIADYKQEVQAWEDAARRAGGVR